MIDWGKVVTPEEKLERKRQEKLNDLARKRWEQETAPFPFQGCLFDTSERSQVKYLMASQGSSDEEWKTATGDWVTLTPVDFHAMIDAYKKFVRGLFVREAALSEQVKGCKTLEEIEAVRW